MVTYRTFTLTFDPVTLMGEAFSPDGSNGCIDRISLNLEAHRATIDAQQVCFRIKIMLHFQMRAAQMQLVLKLELEFRTKWGAVGNFAFDRK